MIVIYHHKNRITKVISEGTTALSFNSNNSIACELLKIAVQFPKALICWCSNHNRQYLSIKEVNKLCHHHKMMLSYNPSHYNYLDESIGYVEQSPFIKVNKKVRYPTWQMSSEVGLVHASLLILLKEKIKLDQDFDYFLNSVAKLYMPLGLFCYSEPQLLNGYDEHKIPKAANKTLFKFVKQHYKLRWLFLLIFNKMIYERKLPVFQFLYALLFISKSNAKISLDKIAVLSSLKVVNKGTIDVIIPTIGRKNYVYDVLCDLRNQTYLPKNVIIVEQNPQLHSDSELDYLTNEVWPFKIKHTFTHQPGACNARNIALSMVESEWVFLNDDDNRFDKELIEKTFQSIVKCGCKVVSNCYLKQNEFRINNFINQAPIFGSGNSFLKSELLLNVSFNMGFEFGYGEDSDFGMQLRNIGADIIYFPEPRILHLSAPIGGFRTKPVLKWHGDPIQPKPSPTVMLYQILHNTREQILGYKTILFFKYYKDQKIKNPISYFVNFRKQWKRSVFWANELNKKQ